MAKKKVNVRNRYNPQKMLLTQQSPCSVQEAYRALRTNVLFSLPGNESKVIGITSPFRAAGKTITSINLATSLKQLGKKVILIDCDLRLPTVATKLGIVGEPGVSNVLVGELNPSDCIVQVPVLNGVHVIPSGKIPPDPTWLLNSSEMGHFIETLKTFYEYVIVDLPPVNMVSDAAILSGLIDGYLLLVRHNMTEYPEMNLMLNQLKFANAKILGFVYNDAPVESKKGGYYYYAKKK